MAKQNVSVLLQGSYVAYFVDTYCKIETERLQFLRSKDLWDAILVGDGDPNNVGQTIILPSTFTSTCMSANRMSCLR